MARIDNKNGIVQNKFTIGTINNVSIYTGISVPANSLGNDGDMYLNLNGDKYTKADGRWHILMRSYFGETTPSHGLGENGDFYKVISTDTSSSSKFVKENGEWIGLTSVVQSDEVPQNTWFAKGDTYTLSTNKRYSKVTADEWVEAEVQTKSAKPTDDLGAYGAIYTNTTNNSVYIKDVNGEWQPRSGEINASDIPDASYGTESDLFYQSSTGKYFSQVDIGSGVKEWRENTSVKKMGDVPFTNQCENQTLFNSKQCEYYYYSGSAWVKCGYVYTNIQNEDNVAPPYQLGDVGDLYIYSSSVFYIKKSATVWQQVLNIVEGSEHPSGSATAWTTIYVKTSDTYYFKFNDAWHTNAYIKNKSDTPTADSGTNYDNYTLNFDEDHYYSIVPNMSSNSENDYEVSASSEDSSHQIFNAFNSSGFWCEADNFSSPIVITVKLEDAVTFSKYKFTKLAGYASPKSWVIATSFTGHSWTDVDSRENVTVWSGNDIEFTLLDMGTSYIRITITAVDTTDGAKLGLSNITLYESSTTHDIYKHPTNGWSEYGLKRTSYSTPISSSGAVGNEYIGSINKWVKTSSGWITITEENDNETRPTVADGLDNDIYNLIIDGVTTKLVKLSGVWNIASEYDYLTAPNVLSGNGSPNDYYIINDNGVSTTYIKREINGTTDWINNTENTVYEEPYPPEEELSSDTGDMWHDTAEDKWYYFDSVSWKVANRILSSDVPLLNYWSTATIYNTGANLYIKQSDSTWEQNTRVINSTDAPDTTYWPVYSVYNDSTHLYFKQSVSSWIQITKVIRYDEAPDSIMWNNDEYYEYDGTRYVKYNDVWTKITTYVNSMNTPLNNYWDDDTLYIYSSSQQYKVSGSWKVILYEEDNKGQINDGLVGSVGDFYQTFDGTWYVNGGLSWNKVPLVIEKNVPPYYTSLANFTVYNLDNGYKYDILSNRDWIFVPASNQFVQAGDPPANGSDEAGSIVAINNTHHDVEVSPSMTSYDIPYNKVSASSEIDGYEIWKAFNDNTGVYWKSANNMSSITIQLEMTKPQKVSSFKFQKVDGFSTAGTITIFGSYDNINWVQLQQQTSITWGPTDIIVTIPQPLISTYLYFKIQLSAISETSAVALRRLAYTIDVPTEYMRNEDGQWVEIGLTHRYNEYSKPIDKDGGDLEFYMLPNGHGYYKRNYEANDILVNDWRTAGEIYKSSNAPINVYTWEPSHLYAVNDYVHYDTSTYRCNEPHTSAATWNTDVIPGKPEYSYWSAVVDPIIGENGDVWFVIATDLYLKSDGAWSRILTERDLNSNVKEAREQVFLFA